MTNLQNLVNQFLGSANSGSGSPLGGLAGGAAAGGLMAVLLGSKQARKFVGNAATIGGMAVLGGLAYRALQNWQQKSQPGNAPGASMADVQALPSAYVPDRPTAAKTLNLTLVKAMIGAAKSDGHIDADEQRRIFNQVDQLQLTSEEKAVVFDTLKTNVEPLELARALSSLEQRAEVYIAACLACTQDTPSERAYLDGLSAAFGLPKELTQHLEHQAARGLADPAPSARAVNV